VETTRSGFHLYGATFEGLLSNIIGVSSSLIKFQCQTPLNYFEVNYENKLDSTVIDREMIMSKIAELYKVDIKKNLIESDVFDLRVIDNEILILIGKRQWEFEL
jgi:hypothetical protein